MTAALDAYKAAMATARAVFDAPQTDYDDAVAAYTAATVAAYLAYDLAYRAQRTSEALQALKRRGKRLGGPVTVPDEIRERIVSERAAGRSFAKIADGLTADGIPTPNGGKWWPSRAWAVCRSVALDVYAQDAAS